MAYAFRGSDSQLFLPLIPAGTTMIGDKVSVEKRDGRYVYFLGLPPIYEHDEDDNRMFKVVTGGEDLPDTERVVNPRWREMDRTRSRLTGRLRYRRAAFTALDMHPESEEDPEKYRESIRKKSELLEEVEHLEKELEDVKAEIKGVPKHVEMGELDEGDKFQGLRSGRKRLLYTVKMIAWRSETAMAPILTSPTVDAADARSILQDLFVSDAEHHSGI